MNQAKVGQRSGRHSAQQHSPTEVVVTYRFHPFCGERFPVVRRFYVHDEPCYIVRRANGMPISFPVWMTQPAAAQAAIVGEAQLPLAVLLELYRLTASCLSLLASDESEGDHDAAGSNTAARTVRVP